jgi:hypothetical protein
MRLQIVSGFNKKFGYRHAIYSNNMNSIPFNSQYGQIIGLEVKEAMDGSGDFVPVVRLENIRDISIGSVTVAPGTSLIGAVMPAPTSSSDFAITPQSSTALEASHVIKTSPGNLYSLYVVTTSVGGYLMTFNSISVPADGAVTPIECIPVPASSIASISADGSAPDSYSVGIVVVFSTTGPFTKTGSSTAFFKWSAK